MCTTDCYYLNTHITSVKECNVKQQFACSINALYFSNKKEQVNTCKKEKDSFDYGVYTTFITMATTALCPDCDKQEGIVPCLGCKQTFCVKHFQIHRQNLFVELENTVCRRNALQEHYYSHVVQTFEPTKIDAWTDVDQWEAEMHEQVRRTADEARKKLGELCDQSRMKLEQSLQQMTEQIQQKMERENFVEEDIEKLTRDIDQMEDDLNHQRYHPQVTLSAQPIPWDTVMQVKLKMKEETIPDNKQADKVPLPSESSPAPSGASKPKYPPSVQRKCFTCGTDTWQKECKCCGHTYCGWHLKRHAVETKKH